LLRTAMIMALPGQFSLTHAGAFMARSVQVMSRPCPRSRLLALWEIVEQWVKCSLIT
jgi:hypothetical protein